MLVKDGTYKAKLMSHTIGETSKGDPQAVLTFAFTADGSEKQINWYGYFTEKTTPNTVKTLITCGLKGNNPAGDLEIGKEVQLVIENEVDDKGNAKSKVRWVNQLGVGIKAMPADLAKAKLSSLEGAVMAARQKMGHAQDSDEIPF